MSGQVKVSVTLSERYRVHEDLCRSLDRIVNETAAGIEINYSSFVAGTGRIRIQYHSSLDCDFAEEIITLERFVRCCQQVGVVFVLRALCSAQNTMPENEAAIASLESWFAEECVRIWFSNILPKDREQATECLCRNFNAKLLLTTMAKRYWDAPDEVARRFKKIKTTRQKEREVHTIGIFNYQMWNGGTDRVICILAPMYEEMGYRVVMITAEGPTPKDFPLSPDIPHLQITWGNNENIGTRFDRWDALIKEYSIDLIIYHPWTHDCLVWDVLFLKSRGVSVLFQTHSIFSFLMAEGKSEFSLLSGRLPLGDGIAVTCKADKIFWSCFHENVHYIPNPVANTLTQAKQTSGGGKKILWIGRFAPEKRPMDAIRIMEYLMRQCSDAVLYMIGSGNEEIQENCRQAVQEKGLEGNVVFLGFQKDVHQYLETASVHVITSVYEGYSMVLQEAMSHGVPTVMYEMPYLDLCRADYGVLSVEESNYKQAAAEIQHLLEDRSAWEQASQAAANGFAEIACFDYQGVWQRLISGEIPPSSSSTEEKIMMRAVVDHYLIGWRRSQAMRSTQSESVAENGLSLKKETAVEWLRRKFVGGVRCIRMHGIRYTLYRLKEKILAKLGKRGKRST